MGNLQYVLKWPFWFSSNMSNSENCDTNLYLYGIHPFEQLPSFHTETRFIMLNANSVCIFFSHPIDQRPQQCAYNYFTLYSILRFDFVAFVLFFYFFLLVLIFLSDFYWIYLNRIVYFSIIISGVVVFCVTFTLWIIFENALAALNQIPVAEIENHDFFCE